MNSLKSFAVVALGCATAALLAAPRALADHTVLLRSQQSDKCVQVDGASLNLGWAAIQSTCDYSDTQKLTFTPTINQYNMFLISFGHSGLCLKADGGTPGAPVEQDTCAGFSNRHWELVPTPDGDYEIKGRQSGLLLSLSSVSSADGVTLTIETDVDAPHQRWRLANVDNRDPSIYGQWGDVLPWPHIPVSGANLPDGRILTYSGSERETWPLPEFTYSATWDPATGTHVEITHATHNMFCAHLAMMEDGNVFVNGGRNFESSPWASIFDYTGDTWVAIDNMATGGRWYPTTVALTDGDMFTAMGTASNVRNPERWDPQKGWKVMTGIDFQVPVLDYGPTHTEMDWWPLFTLAPQGKIFHSGPTPTVGWINTLGNGSYEDTGIRLTDWYHKHGTTVVYDKGRILTAGGWIDGLDITATNKAMTIDLNGPTPVVQNIAPMAHARKFHNGVILPDGEVLVMGGTTVGLKFSDLGAIYTTEFWNPVTEQWREGAVQSIPRNYHSIGLLLPDGRVLSGGGGYCDFDQFCNGGSHADVEIFSPPYLFAPGGAPAARPSIDSGPGMFDNGDLVDLQTTGTIDYFSMVKMSATTHALNTDLRYMRVPHQDLGSGLYRLTMESNPNVLTPGYWMIFAVDTAGVPSEAHVVRVGNLDVRFDNLAPLGGATQSSDATSPHPVGASNAIDGDMTGTEPSGSLALTQSESEAWWELNLFSSFDLDSIRLWNRTDCCTGELADFYVLVSDLPFGTTDLAAARALPGVWEFYVGPAVAGQLEIPVARTGRFVRIQKAGGGPLALAEVQVFGTAPGPGAAGLVHYDYYEGSWSAVPDFDLMIPLRSGTLDGFNLFAKGRNTDYAFRFYGKLNVPATGSYTFYTESDEGSRLWIDGQLVVDNDGLHTQQEAQGSISLAAGEHDILVAYFQAAGADYLTVNYEGPGIAKQEIPSAALALLPSAAGTGTITRDWWLGIPGSVVADLTSDPNYPDSPDGSEEITSFEAPVNFGDDFGQRMYGYLYPPATGLYKFWIAGSSQSHLYLSTDEDPANKVLVSEAPSWTFSREWDKYAQQESSPILLQGGQRYFIEAINKHSSGGDSCAVAWATPFSPRDVVPGAYLSPLYDPLEIVGVSAPPQPVTAPVTMTATANGDAVEYSWSFGDGSADTPFDPGNVGSHTYPGPGRYTVTLTVRDSFNNQESLVFQQLVHPALTSNKPNASSTIVYHGPRAEVWNVNPDNDSVSVIDANLGILVQEIAVPDEPRSLTVASDGRVWVACKRGASVVAIDPSTMSIVQTIPTGRGTRPAGIVAAPVAAEVYATLETTGEVLKFDATTFAELDRATVAPRIRGISITADETTLLVSQFITPPVPFENTAAPDVSIAGGLVHRLLASNLSALGTTTLAYSFQAPSEHGGPGLPNYLQAPVISPSGDHAWVPSKQDNILRGAQRNGFALVPDQVVRAISSKIQLPGGVEVLSDRVDHDNASVGSGAAIGPWGLHLYTSLEGNRQVAVSDAYLGTELTRFSVGRAPQGIALSPSGNTLYVHNFMDRTVGVYDIMPVTQSGVLSVAPLGDISTVTTEALPTTVFTGKQFFYDASDDRLAAEDYMACAACHNAGGQDGRVWDFTDSGEGLRNTVILEGRGSGHGLSHWSGNFDEIQDFENQIRNFAGGSGLMSNPDYTATEPVLGPPKAGLSPDLDALAAYVESLTDVPESPYQAPGPALTAEAESGRLLFGSLGCAACHTGPQMTDSPIGARHDVGTILPTSGDRLGGTLDGLDTPSLIGIWLSPPHLHDGRAPDIATAITAHDGHSGRTQTELDELTAYLQQVELGDGAGPCGATDDTCDGLDNDCNGLFDDGYVSAATNCGVGECAGNAGTMDCVGGTLVDTCDPFLGSTVEDSCDQLDNDCNGVVDDGADDTDGDFLGDACDCAPLDPLNPDPPPVGATLAVDKIDAMGTTQVSWQSMPGDDVYNLYRGYRTVGDPWAYNQQCLGDALVTPDGTDGDRPLPGRTFFYLATSACSVGPSESTPGQDSGNTDRPAPNGCPDPTRDSDSDGVEDALDNCPALANTGQADSDGDSRGDGCDNCPATANTDQADVDTNGIGDACE